MERSFTSRLKAWKESPSRKPLIVEGARQVGKTYVITEFGKTEYTDLVVLNFEEQPSFVDFFKESLDPAHILNVLNALTGKLIIPGETLIFFDEVQQCDRALTSLKYFCEKEPHYHIIAAGSLLGLKLNAATTFPVGKVDFLSLHPMTFFEFLVACGEEGLKHFIESHSPHTPYPEPLRVKLHEYLRSYYYVGGMPESVLMYLKTRDFSASRNVQYSILKSYLFDFSKYAEPSETLKISAIWESVPSHLSKENKKFTFSAVKKSARAREYETALQWLFDAGLLLKASCVENSLYPLSAHMLVDSFKVYLLDIGLLGALMGLESKAIISGDALFSSFNGALVENYVAQTLRALGQEKLFYWSSAHRAEVDFLIENEGMILPVEVKSGFNTHAKSLRSYIKKYKPQFSVRTSLQVQQVSEEGIYDCPLHAFEMIERNLALLFQRRDKKE